MCHRILGLDEYVGLIDRKHWKLPIWTSSYDPANTSVGVVGVASTEALTSRDDNFLQE